MGIFSRLGKGFKEAGKSFGEGKFVAGGNPVACAVCEAEIFERGRAQLNTSGLTFLNLDWANKTASTLVCTNCGYVLWFVKRPERLV